MSNRLDSPSCKLIKRPDDIGMINQLNLLTEILLPTRQKNGGLKRPPVLIGRVNPFFVPTLRRDYEG